MTERKPNRTAEAPAAGTARRGVLRLAAAGLMLSSLLLAGCIRFGPQADEMSTAQNQEQQSGSAQERQEEADGGADETGGNESGASAEQDPQEAGGAQGDDGSADGQSGDAADTADQDASGKASKENGKDKIEVEVEREDSQRLLLLDLNRLPAGYSLSGFVWQPDAQSEAESSPASDAEDGAASEDSPNAAETAETAPEPVRSTYQEAVIAGGAGTEGFFVDADNQRIGYRYGADRSGQSGTIRLDFRDGSGGVASWEAQTTLGSQPQNEPIDAPSE
ncbi:hypothetical protein QWJ34_18435 [Saccharibacillus sp. CPCC 101409]|uniref:hypothetical protein n=1 Tax=Saccharibacillus sp. CPCC 101409 TaxID=3058041 RepID=UPI002671BF68|nr:hypothetical protein [Saccharibacillus sp. CPCC 101409]MDO3411747.1 hypothetical protein [Saccharibacillus sp. CPCC 101409]